MRPLFILAGLVLSTDLSKPTKGLLLSSDCDTEICHSYTIQVSQKFVRLPIKKQLSVVQGYCHELDVLADDYQDEDGHDWEISSCIFQYEGRDIAYQTRDGRAVAEPWYIAALGALRDPK